MPLLDFEPHCSSKFDAPYHLAPMAAAVEATLEGEQRILCTCPPQHGKTELIKHGILWLMLQRPGHYAYCTYESKRAWRISKQIQQLAFNIGLETTGTTEYWTLPNGSSLMSTGVGGPLTGEPIGLLERGALAGGVIIIDDPHKNRREAESSVMVDHCMDWLQSVAEPRCHPGASIIVVQTRWTPGDMIGQLSTTGEYDLVHLRAIDDDGHALWEKHRPLQWLWKKRRLIGEYDWSALYQGEPRPRGDTLFGEPVYCNSIPHRGYQVAYGIDLSYTRKTSSDYSVFVELRTVPTEFRDDPQTYYVANVLRRQCDSPAFALAVRNSLVQNGRIVWRASGVEKGVAQHIRKYLPTLEVQNAVGDKLVNSLPLSAAWNDGRILLPRGKVWVDMLLSEVCGFTGVNDPHDDIVDALAAAFGALSSQGTTRRKTGRRRIRARM
jgi:hypothetical protein